jgi:hypothetical protein
MRICRGLIWAGQPYESDRPDISDADQLGSLRAADRTLERLLLGGRFGLGVTLCGI